MVYQYSNHIVHLQYTEFTLVFHRCDIAALTPSIDSPAVYLGLVENVVNAYPSFLCLVLQCALHGLFILGVVAQIVDTLRPANNTSFIKIVSFRLSKNHNR